MADHIMHSGSSDGTVFAGNSSSGKEDILDSIENSISNITSHRDVVFTDVCVPLAGDLLHDLEGFRERSLRVNYNSLSKVLWIRVKPTRIHNAHHSWLVHSQIDWVSAGNLSFSENDYLHPEVASTVRFDSGPYAGSQKEPDYMIYPRSMGVPTLVVESGWSETWPLLMDDMALWLVGGNRRVNVVILVKWSRPRQANSTLVEGRVELYSLDRNGAPICRQSEQVFPAPANHQQQRICVSRGDIFGPTVFPGRNLNDMFDLWIDRLRGGVSAVLTQMGLQPA